MNKESYVKGKKKRKEKGWSNQTGSSEGEEIHKKGSDRGKTFKKRELKKKNVQKHMRIKQKIEKTNMLRQINMKKCTTKREIDKQVFLQLFHKLVFERGLWTEKTKEGKGKQMW